MCICDVIRSSSIKHTDRRSPNHENINFKTTSALGASKPWRANTIVAVPCCRVEFCFHCDSLDEPNLKASTIIMDEEFDVDIDEWDGSSPYPNTRWFIPWIRCGPIFKFVPLVTIMVQITRVPPPPPPRH